MITIDLSTLVDRPVADTFAFLSNPLNMPQWQTMISRIEAVTPGPATVGSKFKVAAEMMGRKMEGQMEIASLEAPNKFSFTNQAGPMQVAVTITLKQVGTGSKISLHAEGNPGGVFKLAEGVMAGQVKSQMEANLARLKTVLESAK